jgi:hypothetical protein
VRALGLLLILVGAILAAANVAMLPSVVTFHHGEWPVAAFHGVAIAGGVGLVLAGRLLRRRS